jgi:hypothetical protein
LVLAEIDLARQVGEEVRAVELVHHRPLHLGEVEPGAHVGEPMLDRLEALERRHVDRIHRRAHQDHVGEAGIGRHLSGEEILEVAGIGEV